MGLHYIDTTGFPFEEFSEIDVVKVHIDNHKVKKHINKAKEVKSLSKESADQLRKYMLGLETLSLHPSSFQVSKKQVKKLEKYQKQIKKILKNHEQTNKK